MKRVLFPILALVLALGLALVPAAPVAADINSNFQGYWRFDTDAKDFSGKGNNGTLMNGAAITGVSAPVPGDGSSVSLDGINDYVRVPDSATLDFGTNDFTAAAWINVSKTGLGTTKEYGVVNKNSWYQGTPGWGIEVHTWSPGAGGDFAVSFYITNQTSWGNTNAAARNSSMTADAWHHIAGVRDGTTTRLYFDGDLVFTKTHADAGGNVDNSQPVIIGDHSWGPNFPGLIDEARLYARALTEQEIGMLADEGSVALSPNGDINPINASHTVTAEVDVDGLDVTDPYTVNFKVTSGPNIGDSAEVDTGAAGDVDDADFSYTGDGGAGTDEITAWIDIDLDDEIDSGEPQATVTKYWVDMGAVTPPEAFNLVGTDHTVSVDIGIDVAGIEVSFEVSGANTASGSATTDEDGEAEFTYTGSNSGIDNIMVYIDCNGNGSWDEGEPHSTANATKYWFLNFVTGGGTIKGDKNKPLWTFAGNVGYFEGDPTPHGQFNIISHNDKMQYHCNDEFSSLIFSGDTAESPEATFDTAEFTGTFYDKDGAPYELTIVIKDNGEPGAGVDKISVFEEDVDFWVDDGADNPVIINGGNYQIHEGYKG
jgi:hypothetical protein